MKNILSKIIISLIIVAAVVGYPHYYPLPEIVTELTAMVIGLIMDETPATYANSIFINIGDDTNIIYVSPECSGFVLMSVFLLIMFTMPKMSMRKRLFSFLILPIIFLMNVMRIVVSLAIGIYTGNTEYISIFHDTVGQVLLLLGVVILMLTYLNIDIIMNRFMNMRKVKNSE